MRSTSPDEMANAVSIATWFLALVFGWSGASKLYNPAPAAEAIVHFGVAKTARPLLGRLLGTLELGLAVLLAFQLATRVALAGSLLLLAIFVVLIGRSLRRGDRFDCACFVGMEGAVSRSTLARSFALTVISLALLTLEVV